MVTIISQNVPICPVCQAMLFKRHNNVTFYCCADCNSIFKVTGMGKAENELIVTDGRKEYDDRPLDKG